MIALLSVEELTVRFGGVTALDGVTFSVAAGERVALTGPNGAGKTSVLDCLSGVVRPSGGTVRWAGRDLAGVGPAARARLGLARTFQASGVVDSLDVAGNLLLGRHHRMTWWRPSEREHRARCAEVAAELGLDLAMAASALGAGARKRLELGRALAMDGSLLLLDEPFAGAGPDDVAAMVAAIRRCPAAALIVDHDVDTVLGLCDRAVALEAGRLATAA